MICLCSNRRKTVRTAEFALFEFVKANQMLSKRSLWLVFSQPDSPTGKSDQDEGRGRVGRKTAKPSPKWSISRCGTRSLEKARLSAQEQ